MSHPAPGNSLAAVAVRALAVWSGILVLAVANGALREAVLIPQLGTPAALVLSGLLLSLVVVGVAYLALPWLAPRGPRQRWAIGLGWLLLTLAFELGFGLWQGKSWAELSGAYSFRGGNLWPVVLVATLVAPVIAGQLRRR